MKSFSETIKRLRSERNMTKQEFGKLLGVSDVMIGLWEKGTNEPRLKRVLDIEKRLGVSRDVLLGTTESVEKDDEVELDFYGYVSAGNFEHVSIDDGTLKVPRSIFKSIKESECFGLKVNGDSMNRVLSNGSYIVVHDYRHTTPQLNNSDILLIRNGGSHTIKRIRLTETKIHFEPSSYIDEFAIESYDLDYTDDIEIIGRVIYNFRTF